MMGDPGETFVTDDEFEDDAPLADPSLVQTPDAAARLQDLVTFLAHHLVDNAEQVTVETRQQGSNVFVTLRAPEEELGKLIGRQGRIARAVRTALMISAARYNVRASLEIEG